MANLTFDRARPLLRVPDHRYTLAHAFDALTAAYSQGQSVVIYIHGRAKGIGEPKKSADSNIYASLERYGPAVIGFT